MDNHRASPRRKTLKNGKVVLSDWTVMNCIIRDMTETGAKLEFGAPIDLPHDFRLLVIASQQLMPVELSWRRGLSVGVHFTGPPQLAPKHLGA